VKAVIKWFQAVAWSLGGPGLFLIAFVDSSFLSLPEINDLLIIWMVNQHKSLMLYYVTMATLGSVAGCLVLYYLMRRGGEVLLRKRIGDGAFARSMTTFRRYGLLSVLVPSMLPPPAPFKVFVLAAGAARVPVLQFVVAIAVGRGVRYLAEGLLAVWYGDAALDYVHAHGAAVSWAAVGIVLVATALYALVHRRRASAA
jgi:membrane protein YqaA with SNARE-associated domain